MTWYKVAWIDPFFAALNTIAPGRSKASDGTIGDLAHAAGTSGHNPDDTPGVSAERQDADTKPEVRALDADSDLRADPTTMQTVVDAILAYPPDRDRLIYLIFDGWIYRAANGWRREVYTGSDKHRQHAHLSGHPAADEDGRPWVSVLNLGDDMPLSPTELNLLKDTNSTLGSFIQGMTQTIEQSNGKKYIIVPNVQLAGLVTKLDALTKIVQGLVDAAGGSLDVAAVLAGVDRMLADLAREQRDAVADLGEGGSAQVRAGQE